MEVITQLEQVRAQLDKVIPITGCNVVELNRAKHLLADLIFNLKYNYPEPEERATT